VQPRGKRAIHFPFLLPALATVGLALTGCETTGTTAEPVLSRTSRQARADPAGRATPSSDVGKLQAWRDTEKVARAAPGRSPVAGAGSSMQPVYGASSMLVITKVAYADLRPGMNVAYLNRHGTQVVHMILERGHDGWRVQGLNNETEDADRVTPENLLGVVYASIVYED
jgi:hypothetical protein